MKERKKFAKFYMAISEMVIKMNPNKIIENLIHDSTIKLPEDTMQKFSEKIEERPEKGTIVECAYLKGFFQVIRVTEEDRIEIKRLGSEIDYQCVDRKFLAKSKVNRQVLRTLYGD